MASDLAVPYDEAWIEPGRPRPHYAELLAALDATDLTGLRGRVEERARTRGVSFGPGQPFLVDPVPRLLTAAEWEHVERGIGQRVHALEALVRDAYAAREIVAAGLVPERTLDHAEGYEPGLRGRMPDQPLIGVAGLDLVRDPSGEFMVLEDNLRTPSGFTYAAAARTATDPEGLPDQGRVPFGEAALAALARTVCAPGGEAVVLTDGPHNSAHYEHAAAARALGIPLVTPADLEQRRGFLVRRDEEGRATPVDVLYRRTDEDRLRDERGRATPIAELLEEPWLAGRLRLVNAFGTGLADDKVVHAHVEDAVRFYLGEEPVLRSVHTYDLSEDAARAEALARLDELVVKPRGGYGGHGVVICPHAEPDDVAAARRTLERDPDGWVVQPLIMLSRHPTVAGGRLAPRHVDLRPFAFAGPDDVSVPPGALTRVAFGEDALVVNSSQQGGGKDTWVLSA